MSQIAPPGKSWAYLGYANGYAQGGKFIYMAYKDRQMQNRCGSLWLADETGSRPLFDGQLFSHFTMQNGVLTAVQYQDKANTRMTIHYASLDDLALHDIDTPAASRFSFMQAGQDVLFWCSEQHEEETSVLYCQNLSTGETASLTLAQEHLAYASFGYFENTLYFFFQTADGKVRAYNTQTQTDFLLPAFEAASYGSPLTVENGWPIEHKGDIFSSQSLRVCTQFVRQLLQS